VTPLLVSLPGGISIGAMLTYDRAARPLFGRLLAAVALLSALISLPSGAEAQQRKYLFEVGGGAEFQTYNDSITGLDNSFGGVGRIGIWLPLNFSAELEGSLAKSNGISVKVGSASLLYNLLLGSSTWGYLKAGAGGTRYGPGNDECQTPEFVGQICGTTTTFVAGAGVRFPLTSMILLRAEAVVRPNKGTTIQQGATAADTVRKDAKFTNLGLNLGFSFMLGSKPIPDSDADGVLNNRDRCADTPAGAQVDQFGCPADSDGDGVANGIDRCSGTPPGAIVDAIGCTRDSDGDNIADGVDKCPDTPAGVLVDSRGCPRDSDGDGIADGLDRCSATPRGATVDALGCPGDEDADGVLDGLDRCPRTPIGATVNARGCVSGQQPRQQSSAPPPTDTSAAQRPAPVTTAPPATAAPPAAAVGAAPLVLEGVSFESGSARLNPGSYVELDSIAKVLLANPRLRVEIGGHTDDSGTPADNQHLSTLRAEAVRNYLVAKGIPFQQMVARGYGATVPRTPDTTPQGRAANRRVEIKPLPPEP
jgi:outer membrane protein OmpA-like peptidoglycan-associated protein/opacity protein-like surface antigen